MVRKRDDKIYDKKPSPFNGTGEILVRSLLNGEDEMYKAGKLTTLDRSTYSNTFIWVK